MSKLIGTPIDQKNIGLSKLLYELRQNLDIYCLIFVNANSIKQRGVGRNFFGYIQKLAMDSIILNICKIYEKEEKKYPLNSIDGVFNHLIMESPRALDDSNIKGFIQKYGGPSDVDSQMDALQLTIERFRDAYKDELTRFKTFRHKMVAHSESDFNKDKLPSVDVMEKLFLFGADFYELVSDSFIGVGPFDFMTWRRVKYSLTRLLQELGFQDIKTDMLRFQQPAKREPAKTFLLTAES